jgi:hypothetical protein
VLESVALNFREALLIGARQVVGRPEISDRGAQQALVGTPDFGGEKAREDELALHLFIAQLDVEVIGGRTGGGGW